MRRIAGVAVVAVLAALLVQPSALAAKTVKITGGGWGHGIGMGQYGALGLARNGKSGRDIVTHYYTGVRVAAHKMPRRLRVGLLQGRGAITVSGDKGMAFKVVGANNEIVTGAPGDTFRLEASPAGGARLYRNGAQIKRNGRTVFGDPDHPLIGIFSSFGSEMAVTDKAHKYSHGKLEFVPYKTSSCAAGYCLSLVLKLSMQKYLYGLGEVPSSWPQAALRAQAMAGRTYAFEKTTRAEGQRRFPCFCAVYDSTVDQAFIGDSKRDSFFASWKEAVDETEDKIVLDAGEPIQALYSSSSGGHTENNENVWGGVAIPYLRGVNDPTDDVAENPNHKWDPVEMDWSDFSTKLENYFDGDSDTAFGQLQDFQVVPPRGVSDRVTVVKSNGGGVRLTGSNATVRVSGWSVRQALGLRDTMFWVDINVTAGAAFADRYDALDGSPGEAVSTPYTVAKEAHEPVARSQDFNRGRMTWTITGDKVVWQYGGVLAHYDELGREDSVLGLPSSDTWDAGWYETARYENGLIVYSSKTEAHAITGSFADAFRAAGGPRGALGLPVGDARRWGGILSQRFQRGTIYAVPDGAVSLWDSIDVRYRSMGAALSRCGRPVAGLSLRKSGAAATFRNGAMRTEGRRVVVDC